MIRKTKNPTQKLTVKDKEILEKVIFKYVTKFYALIQKYPSPKKYAKEVVIKNIRSNANIATLYTVTYTKNYSSDIFRPRQINQALANDIRKTISKDYVTLRREEKDFFTPEI